jgi:hypothetical protein
LLDVEKRLDKELMSCYNISMEVRRDDFSHIM